MRYEHVTETVQGHYNTRTVQITDTNSGSRMEHDTRHRAKTIRTPLLALPPTVYEDNKHTEARRVDTSKRHPVVKGIRDEPSSRSPLNATQSF